MRLLFDVANVKRELIVTDLFFLVSSLPPNGRSNEQVTNM